MDNITGAPAAGDRADVTAFGTGRTASGPVYRSSSAPAARIHRGRWCPGNCDADQHGRTTAPYTFSVLTPAYATGEVSDRLPRPAVAARHDSYRVHTIYECLRISTLFM